MKLVKLKATLVNERNKKYRSQPGVTGWAAGEGEWGSADRRKHFQSSAVRGKKDIGQQLEVSEPSIETLFVRRLGAHTRHIYRNN